MNAVVRTVSRMLQPVRARLSGMVLRAVIELVKDGAKMQSVQVSQREGEIDDAVEHFQPYGLTGHPPLGSEGIALAVGGNPDHVVLICASKRDQRPLNLKQGEVALYRLGNVQVRLGDDGILHLGEREAADFLARAAKTNGNLDDIKADLDALKAAVAAAATTESNASGLGGMTALNSQLSSWPKWTPEDVDTEKVKAT